MNRKVLLEKALTSNNNEASVVADTLDEDQDVLRKAKRDVEDSISETNKELKKRLSSVDVLDKSIVEVTFKKLQDLKATKALYEQFEKEFITAPSN